MACYCKQLVGLLFQRRSFAVEDVFTVTPVFSSQGAMETIEDHRVEPEVDVEVLVMVVMETNRGLPWPNRVPVDA